MPWAKVQTNYLHHPKVAALDVQSKLLYLASILWTAEHLEDGYVPSTTLRQLCDSVPIGSRWRVTRAQNLVSAGLWEPVPAPRCGWIVHNFTLHNSTSTRAYVEHERELSRQRQQAWRDRQRDT